MLSASMSVDKTLKGYSIAEVASPCTATNVLALKVHVAPPWRLLANWLRVHMGGGRPNRRKHWFLISLAIGIVVAGLWFVCVRPTHLERAVDDGQDGVHQTS